MGRKIIATLICTTAVFFGFTLFNRLENVSAMEQEISMLVEAGLVVISADQIHNLGILQNFYDQARWGIDGELQIIVDPYTRSTREYNLVFNGEYFFLYTGINGQDAIGEYQRLFRIFRNNTIQFVLECREGTTYTLFGYATN